MDSIQPSPFKPEAMSRLVEALRTVGVAGNEDHRFDAQDLKLARDELQKRLRETNYAGGSLSIGALLQPRDEVNVLVYDTNRYEGLSQAERAWEQDYESRRRQNIECRVADWLDRLRDLRLQLVTWLKESPDFSDFTIVDLPPAEMFEYPMRRFNVKPREMPVFELRIGSQRVMRFQPKGLWVVGANGRVDLITRSAAPILVDRSEPGTRPANWYFYSSKGQKKSVQLTKDAFADLIRSALS